MLADAALGLLGGRRAAAARPPRADRPLRPGAGPRRWPRARAGRTPALTELLDAVRGLDAAGPRRLAGRRRRGTRRPPPLGRRDARGLLGRPRLGAHPDAGRRASCTPSRPSSTAASTSTTAPPASGTPSPAACRARRWPTSSTRPRSPSSGRPGSASRTLSPSSDLGCGCETAGTARLVTKALHWLTVAAVEQFLLGAAMDVDHAVDRQEDRSAPRPTGRRRQPEARARRPRSGSRSRTRRARTPSTSGTTTRRPARARTWSPVTPSREGSRCPNCTCSWGC